MMRDRKYQVSTIKKAARGSDHAFDIKQHDSFNDIGEAMDYAVVLGGRKRKDWQSYGPESICYVGARCSVVVSWDQKQKRRRA